MSLALQGGLDEAAAKTATDDLNQKVMGPLTALQDMTFIKHGPGGPATSHSKFLKFLADIAQAPYAKIHESEGD
eukprot:1243775-Pyramimonas_sp.AAC.1